jgi:hypothetical protein
MASFGGVAIAGVATLGVDFSASYVMAFLDLSDI